MTDSTQGKKPKIETLSPVDIGDIWKTEDRHFTPWLADHANLLSEVLGMELQHEGTEVKVGKYKADLVFTKVGSNQRVVVENMFSSTDHDHLGKLLTYAAGLDARYAVLIAEEFEDEHCKTLNHLNSISTIEFSFFGIALVAWRIGESAPAPQFRMEVMPDNWTRANRAVHDGRLAFKQKQYLRFWDEFLPAFRAAHPNWTQATAPSKDNWMTFPSKQSSMLTYTTSFAEDGRLRVEAYIDSKVDPKKIGEAYRQLHERAKKIKDQVEGELVWGDQRPDARTSRISLYFPHPIRIEEEERWPEARAWAIEAMGKMRSAFNLLWQELGLP